ncbi:lipase family protein [Chitinophaga sp. 22536]|uniref:lipase family protein n=1 Tax=unclassified Chitinophaga TaxID=2619133 RepID=UPI003F878E78
MESKTSQTTAQSYGGQQPADAKVAVQLCSLTLDTNIVNDIGTLMPGWKIVWNGKPTIDDNYAFVAFNASEKKYALVIRGSVVDKFSDWNTFANWILEDLNAIVMLHWPYAPTTQKPLIAAGAYIAFTNLLLMEDALGSGKNVGEYLLTHATGAGNSLIIAGHSLGGNIANVYASYFVQMLINRNISTSNISLFTFAAPAAGNADFALDLDNKLTTAWHYENQNDMVPKFPVVTGLVYTSNTFAPKTPDANKITVTLNAKTITLNGPNTTLHDVYMAIAGIFAKNGYVQPIKNNYIIFPTDLNPKLTENSIKDWLGQVAPQHGLDYYAAFLGAKLPVIQSKRVTAEAVI